MKDRVYINKFASSKVIGFGFTFAPFVYNYDDEHIEYFLLCYRTNVPTKISIYTETLYNCFAEMIDENV